LFDLSDGSDGIKGFSGLANRDHKGVFGDDRVFIPELRGDLSLGRNAGFFFKEERSDTAGMPGGSAAEDQDPADGLEVLRGEVKVLKFDSAKIFNEPVMEGLFEGLGLFENFFEHEMLEVSLGTDVVFKAELFRGFGDLDAGMVKDFDFIGLDDGQFVIPKEEDIEV